MTGFNSSDVTIEVPSGYSNMMLVALVGTHQSNVTAASWNSNSLSQIDVGHSAFNENGELWGLLNPTPGSGTFTLSLDGGSWYGGYIIILADVEQTLTVTKNHSNGSSASASVSIIPPSNDLFVISACGSEAASVGFSPINAQLMTQQGQSFENFMGTIYTISSGVPQTPTFSLSSGQRWGMATMCIRDVNTSPTGPHNAYRRVSVQNGMSRSESAT